MDRQEMAKTNSSQEQFNLFDVSLGRVLYIKILYFT